MHIFSSLVKKQSSFHDHSKRGQDLYQKVEAFSSQVITMKCQIYFNLVPDILKKCLGIIVVLYSQDIVFFLSLVFLSNSCQIKTKKFCLYFS